MVVAGESFFISTVQFIVGLGLFSAINLINDHSMHLNIFELTFSVNSIIMLLFILVQFIGIYEVASAFSKFLKGVIEVYKSFRVIGRPRIYTFLKKVLE